VFPQILHIGGFTLHSYGFLVAIGFLVGLLLVSRLARQAELEPERISSLGIYVAVAGILGAKIFLVLGDFSYYRQNPRQVLSLSTLQAGGVFYGGLLFALLTAAWFLRRWNLPAWRTADAFAPPIALGHAIGRLGCFLAGCCWGKPSKLPWAATFTDPAARQMVGVPLGVALHPTQLYEAVAELLIFAILWLRFRRPHGDGSIIGLYLALYSLARFAIEFLRDPVDRAFPFGLPISGTQWLALALAAAGLYVVRRRRLTTA
jgi:phosphatidylglycerol:prolipoprotein diacylglycerol transferase